MSSRTLNWQKTRAPSKIGGAFLIARLPISAVSDYTELGVVTEYVKFFENNSVYLHGKNKAAWSGFEYGLVDKTICGFGEKMGCMGR